MMSGIMNKEPASSLLDMALEIQKDKGWISDDDVKELARRKGMPESQTYEALSFYTMIHLKQPARVEIQVCRGTSCYTAQNSGILEEIEAVTGCKVGTTSADGVYHLDYVECIGQCETAPNVLVNGKLYSSVTRDGIRAILKEAAE